MKDLCFARPYPKWINVAYGSGKSLSVPKASMQKFLGADNCNFVQSLPRVFSTVSEN